MKVAIDSAGEVFHLPDGLQNTTLEVRTTELNSFIRTFFGKTDAQMFPMLNTGSENEYVVFFTKTRLSSSSREVRLANELERHPEITGEERELLQSIFSDDKDVSKWHSLGVGLIEFERNMYDGKYIDACYTPPIPYSLFIKELDVEYKGYELLNLGLELAYPQALLEMAFERDETFDEEITEALERYKRDNGYAQRDKDSNKVNRCIAAITEYKDNCFPVYQQVKNYIRKTFENAYNIRYKGNRITAQLNEHQSIALYVVNNDPALVIVGGMEYSIDNLKDVLASPKLFEETKWFTERVKPLLDGLDKPDLVRE